METGTRYKIGSHGAITSKGRRVSFDPRQLRPEASLNRTRIANLPGANPAWVGQAAYELLSSPALERLAAATGFSVPETPGQLPWSLAVALACQDERAQAVAAEFAHRLGHLVATLVSGAAHEPGESPWRSMYLEHWSRVQHVWLGGGLAAAFGQPFATAALAEAQRLGVRACQVELAPRADVLALVGAARGHPNRQGRALVFDFGQTAVKRGLATFRDHHLHNLELLPALSARTLEQVTAVDLLLDVLAQTLTEVSDRADLDETIMVAVASYVEDGLPRDPRGPYGVLGAVDPAQLEARIRARAGATFHLRYLHDGTAAAAGAPPTDSPAATIVLGTALGVGFNPRPNL